MCWLGKNVYISDMPLLIACGRFDEYSIEV